MAKSSELNLTPSFDLFSKSVEKIKKNIGLYIGVNFMPLIVAFAAAVPASILYIILRSASSVVSDGLVRFVNVLSIIAGLAGVLFIIAAYGAFLAVANLNFAKNKTPSLRKIWEDTKPKIVDIFLAQFLAGLIVIGGFILLIVPGFFMIRRYYLVAYFVADKGLSPKEALKKCKEQSVKASGYIWGMFGVMILLSLTGIVPFIGGIISTILGIMYGVAPALRYLEIKDL